MNNIIPYSKILAIAWAIMIFILSLLPPGAFEILHWDFLSRDKLLHTLFYSIFSFLVSDALLNDNTRPGAKLALFIKTSFICIAFGVLMECLQYLEHLGRLFDAGDIIANCFGTLLGVIVYNLVSTILANYTSKQR